MGCLKRESLVERSQRKHDAGEFGELHDAGYE
jgi:hypothetical protein